MPVPGDFADEFNRADGHPGNGWILSPDNQGSSSIGIVNGALATSGAYDFIGIYRAIDLSPSITVTADLTPTSGFGGLQLRYTTALLFGGNGGYSSGYGIFVYRGDQNYNNSAIELMYNGNFIAHLDSSYQFTSTSHVTVTLETNGDIHGTISSGVDHFDFSFASMNPVYAGGNFTIYNELGSGYGQATLDNLVIDEGSDGTVAPLVFQQPFDALGSYLFTEAKDHDGWTETQDFNESFTSKLKSHPKHTHYHIGEDWVPDGGPKIGADIFAVADGTVVYAQWHPFFGNTVVIAHDVSRNGLSVDTVYSLYAHLDAISVGLGEIDRGEQIGDLGKTGAATGPHLHWEIFSADWQAYLAGPLVGDSEVPSPAGWFDPSDFVADAHGEMPGPQFHQAAPMMLMTADIQLV